MSEIISEMVTKFGGRYPDVPFADGVDKDAFLTDRDPFFVTLPIAQIGVKSGNGTDFNRVDVERIVQQVNEKRPEGNTGHTPKEKRNSEYVIPKVRWLGAMIDGDGVAWGKAWVPSYAPEVREFFRDAKRSGAKVGTSIYGLKGAAGLADMDLESIDLGHPDRLGVREVGAIPQITSELQDETTEANIMAENELIAELRSQRDEKDKLVTELRTENEANKKLVSELQSKAAIADAVIAELGADPVKTAKDLIAQMVDLKKAELVSEIDAVVAELVKVPQLRGIAKKEAVHAKSKDEARTLISEYMETDEYKELATALVLRASGGRAIAAEFNHDAKLDDSPSALAAARAEWGF